MKRFLCVILTVFLVNSTNAFAGTYIGDAGIAVSQYGDVFIILHEADSGIEMPLIIESEEKSGPIIKDDGLLLPMDFVSSIYYEYEISDGEIRIFNELRTIIIELNDGIAMVGNNKVPFESEKIDDEIYFPYEYLESIFGYIVEWNGEKKQLHITETDSTPVPQDVKDFRRESRIPPTEEEKKNLLEKTDFLHVPAELDVSCEGEEIVISVNGEKVYFPDEKPFIDENNRALVPVRAVSEALGYKVEWHEDEQHVSITNEKESVDFYIGQMFAVTSVEEDGMKNGITITMDTAPLLINDRTYVPVRFLCKALSKTVEWDEKTSSVIIEDSNQDISEMIYSSQGIPASAARFDPNNAERISKFYTGDEIPAEWEDCFKQSSNVCDSEEFDMKSGIYETRIEYVNPNWENWVTTLYAALLENVSDKILFEYIPDVPSDTSGKIRMDLNQWEKDIYNQDVYFVSHTITFSAGEHIIFMIDDLDKNCRYEPTIDCFYSTEDFGGTIRITNYS